MLMLQLVGMLLPKTAMFWLLRNWLKPSTTWLNEHCTTYHCCGRSHPFDLAQGGNTLWLTAREICSLASHVTVTRRGHLSIRGLLPQMVSASVTVYEVATQLTRTLTPTLTLAPTLTPTLTLTLALALTLTLTYP